MHHEPSDDHQMDAIYARVAAHRQTANLNQQVDTLQSRHPHARVFREVSSGIDFRRPALRALIGQVISGHVRHVYVTHRDRLCRVAYDLLEFVFQSHGCEVIVDPIPEDPDANTELTNDIIDIMTMFTGSISGGRQGLKRRRDLSEEEPQFSEIRDISGLEGPQIATGSRPIPSTDEQCDAPILGALQPIMSPRPITVVLRRMPNVQPTNPKGKARMKGTIPQSMVTMATHGAMAQPQNVHHPVTETPHELSVSAQLVQNEDICDGADDRLPGVLEEAIR
jgi:predicted site-specific integrase-resolvase